MSGKVGDDDRRSFCQNHEADDDHAKGPGYEKSREPLQDAYLRELLDLDGMRKNAGVSLFCSHRTNFHASPGIIAKSVPPAHAHDCMGSKHQSCCLMEQKEAQRFDAMIR
jgi:hypothetical protein